MHKSSEDEFDYFEAVFLPVQQGDGWRCELLYREVSRKPRVVDTLLSREAENEVAGLRCHEEKKLPGGRHYVDEVDKEAM